MISCPDKIQVQIGEAVSHIASHDFPASWQGLMQDLVSRLSPSDYKVNAGVLQTAHSIFKRYRHEFRSDELYREINFVIDQFCPAFAELFKNTDTLIQQHGNDQNAMNVLFSSLHLMCKIFLSLNSQDIPEFFEDHQDDFMPIFLKYLSYQNPLLVSDDDEEAGLVEKVKSSICEIVDLYAKKYEDVFKDLPKFVEAVWSLLTSTGPQPKFDHLVSVGIMFLASVSKHARHKPMFDAPGALQSICEKIIIPNMRFRESDEELFEDDPIEYIRRDLEGSDTDTRKRSSTDLVRNLMLQFETQLTSLFGGYVNHYMQQFSANPSQNWKDKDTAISLLIAITAKTATAQHGATKTNENINVVDIFSSNIIADLQSPPESDSPHPLLKVDAIKFLNTFRHQLSSEHLKSVFPLLVGHLSSTNYVVHTYSAVCIERILFMKDPNQKLVFSPEDIKPFTETLLTNLFKLIESGQTPEKVSENDYLIKLVMRVIYISRAEMKPYAKTILEHLTKILELISKNPSNPKFNHYVFESIGALVRFLCEAENSLIPEFENMLFPPIQAILQMDIPEFTPYVLQILSQLFELRKESEIPEHYRSLLNPLLQPTLWEMHGNIPALVRLLQAYLSHGSREIIESNQLAAFLGVFQKLVASRANDQFGFEMLTSIFRYIPLEYLQSYLKQIFNILLTRLQSSKTAKYSAGFSKLICTLACQVQNGAKLIVDTMDEIQPKLFQMVAQSVILNDLKKVSGSLDRKISIVALTNFVSDCPSLFGPEFYPLLANMIDTGVQIIKTPLVKESLIEEDFYLIDAEESGYQSAFVMLHSVSKAAYDPAAAIPNAEQYFVSRLVNAAPQIQPCLAAINSESKEFLVSKGISIDTSSSA